MVFSLGLLGAGDRRKTNANLGGERKFFLVQPDLSAVRQFLHLKMARHGKIHQAIVQNSLRKCLAKRKMMAVDQFSKLPVSGHKLPIGLAEAQKIALSTEAGTRAIEVAPKASAMGLPDA